MKSNQWWRKKKKRVQKKYTLLFGRYLSPKEKREWVYRWIGRKRGSKMSLCDNCIHNKVCLHGGNITVCDDMIPKTEWIPVSELPKKNGWYQCTVIVNDLPRTMELFYKNDKWLDNRKINMFNTYDIYGYSCTKEKHKLSYQELISEFDWTEYVIAWKPLSEPYMVESEEE